MSVIQQLATVTTKLDGLIATTDRVEKQTIRTNGRVDKAEDRLGSLESASLVAIAISETQKRVQSDPASQLMSWRGAAAALGFAVLCIAGTVSVLSVLGMLK